MGRCFCLKRWRVAAIFPPHTGLFSIVNPKDDWQMPSQPEFSSFISLAEKDLRYSLDFSRSFLLDNVTIDSWP